MANPGVYAKEIPTSISTPAAAAFGIPFVVGTAPFHTAEKPAKTNVPVLCSSWDEAVSKLGRSDDWDTYTLCEFMYSHFQLYACKPVIFCNVLDGGMKKTLEATAHTVAEHQIRLPEETLRDGLKVSTTAETPVTLAEDKDYSVFYDGGSLVIELLEDGAAYDAAELKIEGKALDISKVTETEIVKGLARIDDCMTKTGLVPDLICCPGWSHRSAVAAVMAARAQAINGLFVAKALIDADCEAIEDYSGVSEWKNKNSIVDTNQILCWPRVKLGSQVFHLSTQLAGRMALTDSGNGGVPYESPSNKALKIDGTVGADGEEIDITFDQSKVLSAVGCLTAINFMDQGWTLRNNYTACYPGNTDVKDQFIPVSRMFDYVGKTVIRTFWSKLDKPLNRTLLDNVVNTCENWLGGLVSAGALLGARISAEAEENPLTSLLDGTITFHIYMTPPVPAQEIVFNLEFDPAYLSDALS